MLKACLSSAVMDELRRDNPASRVVLPRRDPLTMPGDDEDLEREVKALTRTELAAFLAIVHPEWRVFFRLLAATGLRISEALALDVRHLALNGSRPHVKVRRAIGPDGMDRPKSEHASATYRCPWRSCTSCASTSPTWTSSTRRLSARGGGSRSRR